MATNVVVRMNAALRMQGAAFDVLDYEPVFNANWNDGTAPLNVRGGCTTSQNAAGD